MIAKTLLAAVFAASVTLASPVLAQQPKDDHKEHKEKDHKDKDHKKEDKKAGAKVGEAAPEFKLTDTSGKEVSLTDLKGKIVALIWFNPECPAIVQHIDKATTFKDLAKDFKGKDVVILAINSGGPGAQGAGTEKNANAKKQHGLDFPILLDESGKVGKAYGATNTPHCFVIGKDGKVAYNGAIDNGSFGKNGDKNYVREAITALLAGKPVAEASTKPYGCSVKYAK